MTSRVRVTLALAAWFLVWLVLAWLIMVWQAG